MIFFFVKLTDLSVDVCLMASCYQVFDLALDTVQTWPPQYLPSLRYDFKPYTVTGQDPNEFCQVSLILLV